MKRTLVLILVLTLTVVCARPARATVIGVPDVGSYFYSIGEQYNSTLNTWQSSAWGETFRLGPTDDVYLKSLSFSMVDLVSPVWDADSIDFKTYIYEWDGSKLVGDPVFESGLMSTNETSAPTYFNINLNYAEMSRDKKYMWIINPIQDQITGTGGVSWNPKGGYDKGAFYIFHFNNGDLAPLLGTGWEFVDSDRELAFTLETTSIQAGPSSQAVPEPASIVMLGSGLIALVLRRRRE